MNGITGVHLFTFTQTKDGVLDEMGPSLDTVIDQRGAAAAAGFAGCGWASAPAGTR